MSLKKHFLIFIFLIGVNVYSSDYYVSNSGSDNYSGTEAAPFKTIQKAANVMSEFDRCFIFPGTYRETVTVKENNVTFKKYGDGKVIVTGTDIVTGWTQSSFNSKIYEAPFTFDTDMFQFTMFFQDNKRKHMARWPDNETGEMMMPEVKETGYEVCKVFSGVVDEVERTVEFTNMPSFPDNFFQGGVFRGITGKKWWNPFGTITASSGKTLEVDAITKGWIDNSNSLISSNDANDIDFGFIFHLNALDREGEWFHKDGKLYYMPSGDVDPNALNLSAKVREFGFVLNNRDNVTIDGINIHAASIEMKKTNSCEILNSSVEYLLPFFTRSNYSVSNALGGIYIEGNNNEIKNCYIAHSWGSGIQIKNIGSANNSIENCVIEDVGWIGQFTSSLQISGINTIVKNNTFGSSGRFHIRIDTPRNPASTKVDITNNDFYDCMKMGQDAGSIECTNGGKTGIALDLQGSQIAYNKIHDCNTLFGKGKEFVLAFYLEGCYNYTVHHNLVYGFKTDVIGDATFAYLGPRRTTIQGCHYYNNTVWDMDFGIRIWNRGEEGGLSDVRFWNNIINSQAIDDGNDKAVPTLHSQLDFNQNLRNVGSADALFVNAEGNDFRLKSSATNAIDQGVEISGITDGFSGSSPDIGAIEYGSSFPEVGASSEINKLSLFYEESGDDLSSPGEIVKQELKIYPNPATDKINVPVNNIKNSDFKIQIFNFYGKEVLGTGLLEQAKTNKDFMTMEIGSLSPGVYVVVVTGGGYKTVAKLVKE